MNLLDNALEKFEEFFGYKTNIEIFFAPGRFNIIGEHLDYNGGSVLPAALSRGIYALVAKRDDKLLHLKSINLKDEIKHDLNSEIIKGGNSWTNYPMGMIKYLLELGYDVSGVDVLYVSNLPVGSGLSSSAAIEVLTGYFMAYPHLKDEEQRQFLAELAQKVENEFIGVNCGIMDQFAIAMGKRNCAILLNSETLDYKYINLNLKKNKFVILNTNKKRELEFSKFNVRWEECQEAYNLINKKRKIENLAEATFDDLGFLKSFLLKKRTKHVISENLRVAKTVNAFNDGDINEVGKILFQSHISLKNDFEVTGKELDTIVEIAMGQAGTLGARMTGAGFGGCAIALVQEDAVADFKLNVAKQYKEQIGLDAEIFDVQIMDAVSKINLEK